MARYRKPADPRKGESLHQTPASSPAREPIPWMWLGLGIIVTLASIAAALGLIWAFLNREPIAITLPTPTIIRLTAAATSIPTGTPPQESPTPIPTFTPVPTPDLSQAPPEVTAGYFAQVANTDDLGVSLRGGPSTENVRLLLLNEGTFLLVTEGPAEANDLSWWRVELPDGTAGWVAGDFLIPAAMPPDWPLQGSNPG